MIFYKRFFLQLLFYITFLLTSNISSYSQGTEGEAAPISLSDAISIALANNYQIQIAENNISIAQNNNDYGAAGKYPTVTFNVQQNNNLNYADNPASIIRGLSVSDNITGGIDVNWVLFDGYKVRINKKRFTQLEQQSYGNSKLIVENSINAVILAYYRTLIEQQKLGVLNEVKQLSKDKLDYELLKKDLGTGSTFSVLQVENAYITDSLNYILQVNAYDLAINSLQLALGNDNNSRYQLTDTLTFTATSYDFDILKDIVLQDNVNLRNQYINLDLQRSNVELQKSNLYPRVSLATGASTSFNYSSVNLLNFNTGETSRISNNFPSYNYYLNFALSYNIFNGGNIQRNISNAILQQELTELNIKDIERQLANQLKNTLTSYNNQVQILQLNNTLIDNARTNLQLAEDQFKSGIINSFNYRDIQLAFVQANLQKLETIFNIKTTETELIRLTGGLLKIAEE